MSKIRVELRIQGDVQGVFYRASAKRQARALGLAGWARNRSDGSVEIVAEGEEGNVEDFITWCRSGPPGARVSAVDVTRAAATGTLVGFDVR